MLTILVILLILAVGFMGVQQVRFSRQLTTQGPDPMMVALGQVPEGSYRSFLENPEAFGDAHIRAQQAALLQQHKTNEIKNALKAAAKFRDIERAEARHYAIDGHYCSEARKKAERLEQYAQKLINGKEVPQRSAQLRAIDGR